MAKMRLLWDNYLEGPSSITASSEAADYPVEFTQNIWPTLAHRTTAVAAEWLKWRILPSIKPNYFALWGHNFQDTATLYLEANNADAWGAPPFKEAVHFTAGAATLIHELGDLGAGPGLDWWRFTMADAGNPAGYLKSGYAFLGEYFEFHYGYFRRVPVYIDPSTKDYSDGGQLSATLRDKYRTFAYEFGAVSKADYETLWTIFQAIGQSKPYFILEDPTDLTTARYVVGAGDWQFGPIVNCAFTLTIPVEEMR